MKVRLLDVFAIVKRGPMAELLLKIPIIPPTGDHYNRCRIVSPRFGKSFIQWYHTQQAKDWWETVAAYAAGRSVPGKSLKLTYVIYLANRQSMGDTANYEKCIGDALQKCGAIENDRYIDEQHQYRRIDPVLAPLTVIWVRSAQEQLFREPE